MGRHAAVGARVIFRIYFSAKKCFMAMGSKSVCGRKDGQRGESDQILDKNDISKRPDMGPNWTLVVTAGRRDFLTRKSVFPLFPDARLVKDSGIIRASARPDDSTVSPGLFPNGMVCQRNCFPSPGPFERKVL